MKFSVIVPLHNCADWAKKGLDSIRSQEFKDYELICVVDACNDRNRTKRLAEKYADKVFEVNNGLYGPTINTGIENAEGDYLLFMDDDDWFLHEYAFSVLDLATREHPEVDVFFFSFIFKSVGLAHPMSNNGGPYPAMWAKCWKRDFIGDHRLGNMKHSSDLVFHNEMMELKPQAGIINQPIYYYNYMREGSLTDQLEKGESVDEEISPVTG